MTGNQSGAEKDNGLLFREQWMLLFSKSKVAATNSSQSGAELRTMDAIVFQIQDGHHKFQPIRSRIKNSRWRRPRKSAMLENSPPASTEDSDRSHGFPWRHKSRQGHAKNVVQLQNRYLQCPVVLNDRGPSDKWPWWRLRDLGPSLAYIGVLQSIMGQWHHRYPIRGKKSEWIKNSGFPSPPLLRRALSPERVDKWGTPRGLVTPARGGNPGPIGTPGVGIIEAPPRLFVAGNYLPKTMYTVTQKMSCNFKIDTYSVLWS